MSLAGHRAWVDNAEKNGTTVLARLRADVTTTEGIAARMRDASRGGRVDPHALLEHLTKELLRDALGGQAEPFAAFLAEGARAAGTTAHPLSQALRRELVKSQQADLAVADATVGLVREVAHHAEQVLHTIRSGATADAESGVRARVRERRRIRRVVAEVAWLADRVHAQLTALREVAAPYR